LTPAARDEAVETIRQRIDIVELVSRYVKLKKVGSNYTGLCPFHAEKAPSFTVSPRKGFFHCFGCKASGDVFSFLMKIEGKDFPEVLQELADRAGVELPKRRPTDIRKREEGRRQIEINQKAADYYHRQLADPGGGKRARDYLARRGLEDEFIRRFQLGYAPAGWQGLCDHLQREKVPLEDAAALGLLGKGSRGFYDIFRDRLIFPILGLDGKVRGFGARILDPQEEGPKYINSRQSRVFDKSEILYGLQQARAAIQSGGEAVLVEGYFDVLTPAAAGVEKVIATCGTALTENHARVLRRFCEKVITVFDADAAGLAASYRSARVLLEQDLSPYMVTLPAGEDPDSFVRDRGGEAFQRLIEAARPTMEVLAESAYREAGGDIEARTRALKKLLPLLAACRDKLRLGNYTHMLADRFSVGEDYIRQALNQARRREGDRRPGGTDGKARAAEPAAFHPDEETLVVLLHLFPHLSSRAAENEIVEQIDAEPLRELVRQMIDAGPGGADRSWFDGLEDQEMKNRLIGMSMIDDAYPEDKAEYLLQECVIKIRRRHLKTEQRRLTEGIQQAEREGNQQEIQKLQKDKIQLDRELRALEAAS
jgi:DNA primase